MRPLLILIALLATATPAAAQPVPIDHWTPPLQSESERQIASVISWATVITNVALDTWVSWKAPDRTRAFLLQGTRIGATELAVFSLKKAVQRERPCAPSSCGAENPSYSLPSGHMALSCSTLGGPGVGISLALDLGTGWGRIAGGKHWLTDVAAGCAIGLVTSRIR